MAVAGSSFQTEAECCAQPNGLLELPEMTDVTGALIGRREAESKENIGDSGLSRAQGGLAFSRCSLTKRPFVTSNLAIPWSFEPAGLQPR
jgi:hypothetical protein